MTAVQLEVVVLIGSCAECRPLAVYLQCHITVSWDAMPCVQVDVRRIPKVWGQLRCLVFVVSLGSLARWTKSTSAMLSLNKKISLEFVLLTDTGRSPGVGLQPAGIVGPNPAGDMDVGLL
jgi:hypothetical protein